MFKRLKKKVNDFINKMAKETQKEFGDGKLDCCKLPEKSNK